MKKSSELKLHTNRGRPLISEDERTVQFGITIKTKNLLRLNKYVTDNHIDSRSLFVSKLINEFLDKKKY